MKGSKIIITAAAVLAAGAGTAGILMNTKKAKMKRWAKKASMTMYAAGTLLRTLSCRACAE